MRIIKRTDVRLNGVEEDRYYCPGCMRVLVVGFVGAKVVLPETCSVCGENLREPEEKEE